MFAGLGSDGLSNSCHSSRSVTMGHDLMLSSCRRWHHTPLQQLSPSPHGPVKWVQLLFPFYRWGI